jgi:hypothetical protein
MRFRLDVTIFSFKTKFKKTQTTTYVGTMGDYFFSKKKLAGKGCVYGYLANSFEELVLTFDMWFSKIIKLVWPLIKVLMNQKTYLEPLIFYTKIFMKTINY